MKFELKFQDYSNASQEWSRLERIVQPSYFQSSTWQTCWNELIARHGLKPQILTILHNEKCCLMSSFVLGTTKVLKIFPRSCAFLNTTGIQSFDVICAEGNQPMILGDSPIDVITEFLKNLSRDLNVKEIFIDAVPETYLQQIKTSCTSLGMELIERKRSTHYSIDLQTLRDTNQTPLSALNSSTRKSIGKKIRQYTARYGDLDLVYASSSQQAKQWFEELIKLNVPRLHSKNINSSFSFPFLREFHLRLIEVGFPLKEIVLAKISSGGNDLGFIYGFLYHGTIYIYQTGFNFNLEEKLSPGIVSHYLLAQDCFERGMACYDFLSGDYPYKKSLSNKHDDLVWLRISKPTLMSRLDHLLRVVKRKIIK